MSVLEDRSDRWSDSCLALVKAISIILLIACLVYLAVAGMNYAVLGAVFFEGEHAGTIVTIAYALVLFAMALAASLLGLRASYEPSRIDPFCIAAGVLVVGVLAGVASGNFGYPDSAFGSGIVGGLNLFFGVIALVGAGIGIFVIRPEVKPAARAVRDASSEVEGGSEASEGASAVEDEAGATGELDVVVVSDESDAAGDADASGGAAVDGGPVETEDRTDDEGAPEGDVAEDAAEGAVVEDVSDGGEPFASDEATEAEDEQADKMDGPVELQEETEPEVLAESGDVVEPDAVGVSEDSAVDEPVAEGGRVEEDPESAVAAEMPNGSVDEDDFHAASRFAGAPAPEPRPVGDVRSTPLPRVARTAMAGAQRPVMTGQASAGSEPSVPHTARHDGVDEIEWVDFGADPSAAAEADDEPGFFGKHLRRH